MSWIWIVAGIVALSFIVFVVVFIWLRRKKETTISENTLKIAEQTNVVILRDTAFVRENSTLIGTGNFGLVYKCFMNEYMKDVAVKIASSENLIERPDERNGFAFKCLVEEIKVMIYVGQHENILAILGCCYQNDLFLVTEYCVNGSLLTFLRNKDAQNYQIPSNYELIKYCVGIARGIQYLHGKDVIHGDLSARNVLLNENGVCKVSDFVLSRKLRQYEIYVKKGKEPLPWRWMAFESLSRMEFTPKSDTWSMAVTFWEIFTLGKLPYSDVLKWDDDFVYKLSDGLRLEQPRLCNDIVYNVMLKCWNMEREKRPSPDEILNKLTQSQNMEYDVI